jgi:hypothetical protein
VREKHTAARDQAAIEYSKFSAFIGAFDIQHERKFMGVE